MNRLPSERKLNIVAFGAVFLILLFLLNSCTNAPAQPQTLLAQQAENEVLINESYYVDVGIQYVVRTYRMVDTATVTPTVTATTEPTETVAPTQTNTPEPTATSEPTATPTAVAGCEYHLTPVADAFVRSGSNANNNYGDRQTLNIKTHDYSDEGDYMREVLIQFDLSPYSSITAAQLVLEATSVQREGGNIAVYSALGDWSEDNVTWHSRPVQGNLMAIESVGETGIYSWDVTGDSFILQDGSRANNLVKFSSREGDTPPALKITAACSVEPTATPQPTSTPEATATPPIVGNCTIITDDLSVINSAASGDTVCIEEGVYQEQISVNKNGPITVRGLGDVVLDGGRTTILDECGGSRFGRDAGPLRYGIYMRSHDNWTFENFTIQGFNDAGIRLDANANDNTFRDMHIENNGSGWEGEGVQFAGQRNLFERMTVINNAQDSFQTKHEAGTVSLTVRDSFLGNTRPHSSNDKEAWNECTHTDAIQVHKGSSAQVRVNDVLVENVIAVGTSNTFMLQADQLDRWTFNNVLVEGYDNAIFCGNPCNDFKLQNVTVYMPWMVTQHGAIWLDGSGHEVNDSIFVGTNSSYTQIGGRGVTESGNCYWNTTNWGTRANPNFVDPMSRVGDMEFNFTPQNSECSGGYSHTGQ